MIRGLPSGAQVVGVGVHDGEMAEVGVVEVAVVVHVDLGDGRPRDCAEGAGGCVCGVEETGDVGCAGGG